jgi:hypothetical protein
VEAGYIFLSAFSENTVVSVSKFTRIAAFEFSLKSGLKRLSLLFSVDETVWLSVDKELVLEAALAGRQLTPITVSINISESRRFFMEVFPPL